MKHPFLWISFGLASGILLSHFVQIDRWLLWTVFTLGLFPLWLLRGTRLFIPVILVLIACLAIIHTQNKDHTGIANEQIETALNEGNKIRGVIIGRVVSDAELVEKKTRKMVRFVLETETFITKHEGVDRFYDFQSKIQVFILHAAKIPSYGDRVRIWGDLSLPKPALNPGQFDYAEYLKSSGIEAVFQGMGERSFRVIQSSQGSHIRNLLSKFRQLLSHRISELFSGTNEILYQSMILGYRQNISNELRETFSKTGTAHLLSISGLHITLVSGSLYLFLLCLKLPQRYAALLSLLVVVIYISISGMRLPSQRAGIMAGCGFLAVLLQREWQMKNLFFIAFVVVLIIAPKTMMQISFQLSFLSVFALLWGSFSHETNFKLWVATKRGALLSAFTFPLILYYFHIFSLSSIVANLVAIPIFHAAILSGFSALLFANLPILGALIIFVSDICMSVGKFWVEFIAKKTWTYWYLPSPSVLQLCSYYVLLILILVWPKTWPKWTRKYHVVSIGFCCLIAITFLVNVQPNNSKIIFLSVASHEMAFFQMDSEQKWIMNTGGQYPSSKAERIITPLLRHWGIKRIRGIILGGFAKKQTGGLHELLTHFQFKQLIYPFPLEARSVPLKKLRKEGVKTVALHEGMKFNLSEKSRISYIPISKTRNGLSLEYFQWRFIIIPKLTTEVLKVLEQQNINDPKQTVIWITRKIRSDQNKALFEELFKVLQPRAIVTPGSDPMLEQGLAKKNTPIWSLSEFGALTFAPSDIHNRSVDANLNNVGLTVRSFRKGLLSPLF